MVWAFIVLLGTIALAFLSLLAWPIRMLIRRMRGTPSVDAGAEANRQADPNASATPPPSNVNAQAQ